MSVTQDRGTRDRFSGNVQDAPNSGKELDQSASTLPGLPITDQHVTEGAQGRLLNSDGTRLIKRQRGRSNWKYQLRDLFLTLIQIQWPYVMGVFMITYIVSWLLFAGLWYGLNSTHECLALSNSSNANNFNAMLIFSIAVQTTIGFGNDYIRGDCYGGAVLLVVQCLVGLVLDGVLLGLIVTKASRAKSRAQLIRFSRHGVVCRRNGQLCLLWRIADLRNRSMCEAHVRAYCYREQRTREGERLDWECCELDLGYDTGRDRILLLLPVTVCHYITESSPFYRMTREQMLGAHFEVVLLLEGIIEATGLTAQAMHSYTSRDIRWGCRFVQMVHCHGCGPVTIDYEELDSTETIVMDSNDDVTTSS